MNRIDSTFARLQKDGRSAFITYISAGDPDMPRSLAISEALETAGADILELGVPFSDPLADGIVNQMAADRALKAGATTRGVLEMVRELRKTSEIPVVLFTYLNPIYTYGFEQFHKDAADAGVDGILLLDLPPHEEPLNAELAGAHGLKHIRLIAPTTPDERIPEITAQAEGFIYYVSRAGVTGAQTELSDSIASQVAKIKATTSVPVAVGFGISTPEQAATVAAAADGVVVGSAIVKIVEQNATASNVAQKVGAFAKPLADAIKTI